MFLVMGKKLLIGISLAAVAVIGCWLALTRQSASPASETGAGQPAERGNIDRDRVQPAAVESLAHLPLTRIRQQGDVAIARLEETAIVDGFPCAAGWIHFNSDGRLRAFFLGQASVIQGSLIPAGTWIRLNPDLTLRHCAFPQNTEIQGYLCRGGFGGSEGVMTGFHPGGELGSFFPPEDIVIQGIPCKASLFSPVYLHENGNLKQFTLAGDAMIDGQSLSAWQTVVLSDTGQIQSVSEPSRLMQARNWISGFFRRSP